MDSFWKKIPHPIIGLSPMDGITDPAFRAIVDEVGHPTVLYTEFISADGLARNSKALLRTFTSHPTETPLIGQLFGSDVGTMKEAVAILLDKTTVRGIDINMGCPNRHVARHGGGAALINTPKKAQELIIAVRETLDAQNKPIGLSVKTRIGIDEIVTERWMQQLIDAHPDTIALHGRTLKQMYTGVAQWDEIGKAARLVRSAGITFLGNGDIDSRTTALERIKTYQLDGVLIGRGCLGNPWVFSDVMPTISMRIDAARKQCGYFNRLTPKANPLSLRKHLAWYIKGFPDAAKIRDRIMQIVTVDEAIRVLDTIPHDCP